MAETLIVNRLISSIEMSSDDERAEAFKELTDSILNGTASPLTTPEIDWLCHLVTDLAEQVSASEWYMGNVWSLLLTAKKSPQIRKLALQILANRRARCRFMAFNYIDAEFPGDARDAYVRYEKDTDPELLHVLGWFVRTANPSKAVHFWIDAISYPMSVTLRDTLELEIVGLGMEEHLQRLRELQARYPTSGLIKTISNNLEKKLKAQRDNVR